MNYFLWSILSLLVVVFIHDRFIQTKHVILKHYPILGHIRYFFEYIRPEIRQYFIEDNRNGSPFNRSQRDYIYQSSKGIPALSGFGSDADFSKNGHFFIKQSGFSFRVTEKHINHITPDFAPCAKVIGEFNRRAKKYRSNSIVNISAMSFGALGSGATTANNIGAKIAYCYHNTGEGGFSQYHNNGADVVFQIGTAYYGCRDEKGNFSMAELIKLTSKNSNIKMIEIKLSQGAKANKGGILPADKVTKEIAEIRRIPVGQASVSPGYHSAFSNVEELVSLIEQIARKTGLPVGIKSAVGNDAFWWDLAYYMVQNNKGPDFITIDGGEGGTGAAPTAFSDNVSLPFEIAFTTVYKIMQRYGLEKRVTFIASAKLGLPAEAVRAFSLGADMINMAREILMAGGCIQAQKCHTGNCPTLIATNKHQHLYNVEDKSQRVANFVKNLRKDILEIAHACGYEHPCQFRTDDIDVNTNASDIPVSLKKVHEYSKSAVDFGGMSVIINEINKAEC